MQESSFKLAATHLKNSSIINVGNELSDHLIAELKDFVMKEIHVNQNKSIILVLSGLKFMDSQEFNELHKISRMTEILGAQTIFVGLNPGIIIHLMSQDVDIVGIKSYLSFEDALNTLENTALSEDILEDTDRDEFLESDFDNNDEIDQK
jgi:rsbT antagonist protein RsbS